MKMMASVTALAALFGSVSAFAADENKPVDLTTTITVKNRAACSLAVTHSGSAAASVTYIKGATIADSKAELAGGESTLTVEAGGGDACDVEHLSIGYTDNATEVAGSTARGVSTKSGKGIYPMHYGLSSYLFTDKNGDRIDEANFLSGLSNYDGRATESDIAPLRVTMNTELSRQYYIKGQPVELLPGPPTLVQTLYGETNTSLSHAFPGAVDRRWKTPKGKFSGAKQVAFKNGVTMRKAVLDLSVLPADGFYNVETGLRDDSVVGDDESLEFKATFTVTAY